MWEFPASLVGDMGGDNENLAAASKIAASAVPPTQPVRPIEMAAAGVPPSPPPLEHSAESRVRRQAPSASLAAG
jgi:hypothetical protein